MRVGHGRGNGATGREELPLLGRNIPIPPEVPFSDRGRAVAVLLREPADREAVGRDQRRAEVLDDARLQTRAPMVAAREQRVAGRRTHAGRSVRVGETHPLRREPVEVRGPDFSAAGLVALHVAVA
jgi:hypothetical protein